MNLAIEEAKKSTTEDREDGLPSPKVGAVIVDEKMQVIASAHRGELGKGTHAEFCCLTKIANKTGVDVNELELTGATVFTTLEPCTYRGSPKKPCSARLADAKVQTVFIGSYDPNPRVYRRGWNALVEARIRTRDFPEDLRKVIDATNIEFDDLYRTRRTDAGTALFDYRQNGGIFTIDSPLGGVFNTQWGQRGQRTIHIIDQDHNVARALFAQRIDEIDDPSAYDFSSHTVHLSSGEVGIIRNSQAYLLVKVINVKAGSEFEEDDEMYMVEFEYGVKFSPVYE